MKYLGNFFRNKDGILSIEFAACFCLFSLLVFIIYDVYSTIMLQNKLERANYTVASIFRERSAIYPIVGNANSSNNYLTCIRDLKSCYKSHELFDDNQVQELRQLASLLLDRDVAIKVDALFVLQDPRNPQDLRRAKLATISSESCSAGACDSAISYFSSLPDMIRSSNSRTNNYLKLIPYVQRTMDTATGLTGRWIPLYRISMCIVNEESLYLKWVNSNRETTDAFPNLCSNIALLSRCNNIAENDGSACPIYHR
jgi:tight adherence protein F